MANLEETRAWASTFFADLRFNGNGKNGALPYRLHLPGRYERGKTYPLVLLMHGYGSIGSDNWGPLFFCGLFAGNPKVDLDNVFILAPQCPADGTWIEITDDDKWLGVKYTMSREPVAPMKIAMEILDHVVSSYPIDRKRLYVGGNSMGGFATWDILSRHPKTFAAAFPICGGGDPAQAAAIATTPVWAFHGDADTTVLPEASRRMVRALQELKADVKLTEFPGVGLQELKADVKLTEFPGVGHDSWTPALTKPEFAEWLFAHSL